MPPAVVTVTSTVPVPGGEVTVTELAVFAVIDAPVEPKWTAVAEPRFEPEMTTLVPPDAGPEVGEMPVTAGAGT